MLRATRLIWQEANVNMPAFEDILNVCKAEAFIGMFLKVKQNSRVVNILRRRSAEADKGSGRQH